MFTNHVSSLSSFRTAVYKITVVMALTTAFLSVSLKLLLMSCRSSTHNTPVGCLPLIRVDIYPPPTNVGSITLACCCAHFSRVVRLSQTQYPSALHFPSIGTTWGKTFFHAG